MDTTIRELTEDELKQVEGGVLPILGALASFAGHMAVRSVGKYYLTRGGTIASVYGVAEFLGD